ncbi:sigma-54-dependent transcriptional regulator [Pirellula sp. SH-Sr6A]|uniref:sigma-54-dependent transcriptional regulator n=1 Tax=Pirellula sp. SH-Sr6A TaxID=1632865 RepID=UPI001F0A747D
MQDVFRITRRVAPSNASVLLLGETGSGKEVIANAIHQLSGRNSGPFVKVNCGALSESLLESELFGHVRGAFTGAVNNRAGRFEAAHSGTIFLDEINSTSMHLQVKLLRVLQQKEFERVGDTETVSVDTRVIAASNRDLAEEIKHERFREDLYWRLNVVPIEIPPLRKRREDIPALVGHFLQVYSTLNERYVVHIEREAMQALQDYHWPGNVRELQNYIERSVVMAETDELTCDLLPTTVTGRGPTPEPAHAGNEQKKWDFQSLASEVVVEGIRQCPADATNLHNAIVDRVEKELIAQVLSSCNYVQTKAATRLGINRNTLHKKMKDYSLDDMDPNSHPNS